MNEKPENKYCVLILIHDAGNTYAENAYHMAKAELKGPGIVQIHGNVFIVEIPTALPAMLLAVAHEIRLRQNVRRVRFCLIPCGSSVFGELLEEVKKPLADLGLSFQETPIPDAPPLR